MTGTLSTQETSQTPWEPVATGGQWTVLDGLRCYGPLRKSSTAPTKTRLTPHVAECEEWNGYS